MCHRGGDHFTYRGVAKSEGCVRHIYHALNKSSHNAEGLLDVGIYRGAPDGQDANLVSSQQLATAKFALCLDGATIAWRLPGLLRGGQLVMLDDTSPMYGYYYEALQPWVHYVPVSRDAYEDIFNVTRFLIANDHLAQSIADNGREFALQYLTRESALCYTKKMLDTYSSLIRFTPRPPSSRSVSLRDAIAQVDLEQNRTHSN